MNKVSGHILHKETRLGIPWLIVEIYDIDPGTQPEERLSSFTDDVNTAPGISLPGDFRTSIPADRIGSATTDKEGYWKLNYEDSSFRVRNKQEQRPDLVLIVTAPERLGLTPNQSILYASGIRQNAGVDESYIILLTTEQLTAAGIPLPKTSDRDLDAPNAVIAQFNNLASAQSQIYSGIQSTLVEQVDFQRELTQRAEVALQIFYENLSTVPEVIRNSEWYVKPGEKVEDKIKVVLQNDIQKSVNSSRITGYLSLSEERIQDLNLRDENGDLRSDVEIQADVVESIIFDDSDGESYGRVLYRENPADFVCREIHVSEPCHHLLEDENSSMPPNGDSANRPAVSEIDSSNNEAVKNSSNIVVSESNDLVTTSVTKLMEGITSPEMPISKRPTPEDIQASLNAFQLRKSPADNTSYYDFHNLEIAFEHVWQEAFDEDVIDIAKDLYEQTIEQGGRFEAATNNGRVSINVLKAEARNVFNTQQNLAVQSELASMVMKNYKHGRSKGNKGFTPIQVSSPPVRDHRRTVQDPRLNERVPARRGDSATVRDRRTQGLTDLIDALEERLKEPHSFKIFSPNSVNFGILVTYRQEWEPLNYQVGKLVSTIPLAPGEERTYSKKVVEKLSRAQKETEKNLSSQKRETSDTYRAEAEIVQKAEKKTNFELSAENKFNIKITSNSVKSTLKNEAGNESKNQKKSFQEAVAKAAQEYSDEHHLEVTTEESIEFETTETGKIINPNNEITLTCLFYELQRRFRVSSKIYRVMPVILVAQEVPKPNEIDEDWLIAHDWILKRVLLDDSCLPALMYLSTRTMGDEFSLQELRNTLEQQRQLVNELKRSFVVVQAQVDSRYSAFQRVLEQEAGIVGGEKEWYEDAPRLGLAIASGGFSEVARFFGLGDSSDENEREAARIRQEAAKDSYERAVREAQDLQARLEREVTALQAATEAYTRAHSEQLNRKVQIAKLKLHVKSNILYYMQAIWNHEPPDQRFFRLCNVRCPVLKGERTYTLSPAEPGKVMPNLPHLKLSQFQYSVRCQLPTNFDDPEQFRPLVELADLDNLLGYKGNYAIFPLKQSNDLTDYMLAPYLDAQLGLRDPDDFGNWTLDDFLKYVCCLKKNLSEEDFDEIKDQLRAQYKRILTAANRDNEEIIVPTNSLFIEALPGAHPILEDFKLMHRAMDVQKVQAEVRQMELENVRMAARLVNQEYEDPNIESRKEVIIKGHGVQPVIDLEES